MYFKAYLIMVILFPVLEAKRSWRYILMFEMLHE